MGHNYQQFLVTSTHLIEKLDIVKYCDGKTNNNVQKLVTLDFSTKTSRNLSASEASDLVENNSVNAYSYSLKVH
jgi:hypothetical protein